MGSFLPMFYGPTIVGHTKKPLNQLMLIDTYSADMENNRQASCFAFYSSVGLLFFIGIHECAAFGRCKK